MHGDEIQNVVSQTQTYYDGPADEIYQKIWGDDVHLGLFQPGVEDLPTAAALTNRKMASMATPSPDSRVLDLGCGYGSAARYLARENGCHVTGINISKKELKLAEKRAKQAGLDHLTRFEYGDFHDLQFKDSAFDILWSQEAFLHGADKNRILSECLRVLQDEGRLVFTDILVRKDTPEDVRQRIYERVRSPDMWDRSDYQKALQAQGFTIQHQEDWSAHVAPSYTWVRDQVVAHKEELSRLAGAETVEKTIESLTFWVQAARDKKIGWAFFLAQKRT
jgi:sarcosine/dimethylglycine N-methyltransferase